jgi:hypothetical protein
MTLVELVARLGLKVDEGDFQKGTAAIGGLKAGLAAVGISVGAARAALEAMVVSTAAYGNAAQKSAQRIGVNVEAFQEIVEAADDVQVSAGSVEAGLRFLGRNAYEASKGSQEAAGAFRTLGVSVRDSNGKLRGTDSLLMDLADKFTAMPDGPEKTALAMKVLGRGGTEMIPLLNKGSVALAEMRKQARETGLVLDKEGVASAVAYTEALDGFEDALTGIKRTIGVAFRPQSTALLKQMGGWIAANRELIATRVRAFVEGFGAAMKRVKQVLDPFIRALGWLVSQGWAWKAVLVAVSVVALGQFGAAMGAATAAIATMLAGVKAITAAQILGAAASVAAGLLWAVGIAIIALAIEDLFTFMEGGDSAGLDFTKWLDGLLKIDPSDSPLLKGLKMIVSTLTDLQGAGEKIDKWFHESSDNGFASVLKGINAGIEGNRAAAGYHFGQAFLTPQGQEAAGVTTLPGSTISASGPGAGGTTNAPIVNVQVTAPTGTESPDEWGKRVGDVVTERLGNMFGQAYDAAPLVGGGR